MAIYEYEHTEQACAFGKVFEFPQSIHDAPLSECPKCGGPVKKLISVAAINTPKTDSELKNLGFTKLVRRDDGVYENVTRRDGESRYMEGGKKETMPDLKKIIKD